MTKYSRGDIVLVNFIFADESGTKRRPAFIVSTNRYNSGRDEAVAGAITSRTERLLFGDHLIINWQKAGLLYPSVATGIIQTVKQGMIARKLGFMPSIDMELINDKMRLALGLA